MLIGPNFKRMRKLFKMTQLQNDNIRLRDLVVKLAKVNLEGGGLNGSTEQDGEGEVLPALQSGVENDSVAVEESCSGVPASEDSESKAGTDEEGV